MRLKYVVSIEGELLYFDEEHNPVAPLSADSESEKPDLKLLPTETRPAAGAEWNEALTNYTDEQRNAAEISEVQ